jgi:formate hydrogenlyase subunit 4
LAAALIVPSFSHTSPFGFTGDVIAFAYIMGLGRLFTMVSAMDTGSSFEAMGASREGSFSALAEPALFLSLGTLCIPAHSISFERVWCSIPEATWVWARVPYLAVAVSLFIVLLSECSRIPVDDPNTHLELTMVHEVMVLDHSGPDLAFIELASALRLFVLGSIVVHIVLPATLHAGWLGTLALGLGQVGVAVAVGMVESLSARYRLTRVPQFMLAASVVAVLAIAMHAFEGGP